MTLLSYVAFFGCLCGSVVVWAFMSKISRFNACLVTICGTACVFSASVLIFIYTVFYGGISDTFFFEWMTLSWFSSSIGVYADSITACMLVVISFVSLLVHIYSVAYMEDDEHLPRFMAYLSLFTFFMIVLVCARDFLQLFIGWEGVGLSSYLLIGFWFKKDSANQASMKAFVTNRIGDFALIIGIAGLYHLMGTLNFQEIWKVLPIYALHTISVFGYKVNYLSFVALMLFIGCMGKSAQLFLHVWLPDAMEGPTPVSALIHAATMVTAGVFLIVRCSPLFAVAHGVGDFIVIVGVVTALFGAITATAQNDIKKIIAYSTCSQLGYMFMACGLGAYSAAMFHLITHAFFKALLFLSAGSVIIATHHEQDIRHMGGLWNKIPVTFTSFMVGSLAIAGIFPFAGFFSKESILSAAQNSDGRFAGLAYCSAFCAALFTAFYSWRLLAKVFHGKNNNHNNKDHNEPHEPNLVILIPLSILSVMSIISGFFLEHFFYITNSSSAFWNGAIAAIANTNIHHEVGILSEYGLMFCVIVVIGISYTIFLKTKIPSGFAKYMPILYNTALHKFYFDEIYAVIIVKPYNRVSTLCSSVDKAVIDFLLPRMFILSVNKMTSFTTAIHQGFLNLYLPIAISSFVILICIAFLVKIV